MEATPSVTMPVEAPVGARSECGSMRVGDSGFQYAGGDHWVAILDGIADLKDHVDREEQLRLAESSNDGAYEQKNDDATMAANPPSKGAFLLYGCRRASRNEILSALPPKYAVDCYGSHYVNYLDLVSSCKSISCCRSKTGRSNIPTLYSYCPWTELSARGKISISLPR
ncbi:uncharacterized protein BDV17DRAFT_225603 [Aspergillus undulatus]|uniref:uncharacterized protein n=1 Tax=Aspergillus undulatus TaxID=1810928 RepID=UPI003CCDFE5A